MNALRTFCRRRAGTTQLETVLLIAFVAVAGLGFWQQFGQVAAVPVDHGAEALDDGGSSQSGHERRGPRENRRRGPRRFTDGIAGEETRTPHGRDGQGRSDRFARGR